jgi:protein-L-isoaspartate(D-aspartate) O-methyltransferase
MVETQIAARGVSDPRVLAAMSKVPRHRFVPENLRKHAYDDEPLPSGHGQTSSQPYIVAYMTEALALTGTERVLEVGTGTGYQTAVLAEVAKEVLTVEIVAPLSEAAGKVLGELGYANIRFRVGNGANGWPEEAPFDAIMVTAAPAAVPHALKSQLGEGGRMVIPVGTDFQDLVLVRRSGGRFAESRLLGVRFVPLV